MDGQGRLRRKFGLEAQYWSGASAFARRGTDYRGAILRFQRVRPRKREAFQPWSAHEVTPRFLDRAIHALRRWRYDVISLDDVPQRMTEAGKAPFVVLTFDGGTRDQIDHAMPVLRHHGVPFTIFTPTAFADEIGFPWWLVLEAVVARNTRIAVWADGQERRFICATPRDKSDVFRWLMAWLMAMPADEAMRDAVRDLARRYGVGVTDFSGEFMTFDQLRTVADIPVATIGCATVSFPLLTKLSQSGAEREIAMGRSVIHAALGIVPRHFAYPFGQARDEHIRMTRHLDFATAVTTEQAPLRENASLRLCALPRISIGGRLARIRYLRAMLAFGD